MPAPGTSASPATVTPPPAAATASARDGTGQSAPGAVLKADGAARAEAGQGRTAQNVPATPKGGATGSPTAAAPTAQSASGQATVQSTVSEAPPTQSRSQVASLPPPTPTRPAESPAQAACSSPLADAELQRLLKIPSSAAGYADARRCIVRHYQKSRQFGSVKTVLQEQVAAVPGSRFDAQLLSDLAEAELLTGEPGGALKHAEEARRYTSRVASANPWRLEARVQELLARSCKKLFEQTSDAAMLEKAIQRWTEYKTIVSAQDPSLASRASRELEQLEIIRKRLP